MFLPQTLFPITILVLLSQTKIVILFFHIIFIFNLSLVISFKCSSSKYYIADFFPLGCLVLENSIDSTAF